MTLLRRPVGVTTRSIAQLPPHEPEAAVDFAVLAFWASTRRKPNKNRRARFAERNEAFRTLAVSHWNHYGCEMTHFAELFVFNGSIPISFRANRQRRSRPP